MIKIIWTILVILTLFAFLVGYLKLVSSLLVGVLLLTTFIKGGLVIEYFMGLKDVTLKYRLIPTLWLASIILLIGVAYYLPL